MVKKNNDLVDLIEKARKKDQKAFNTLLNTYWSDVYRFQLLKTEDEDEAEDIMEQWVSRIINTYYGV